MDASTQAASAFAMTGIPDWMAANTKIVRFKQGQFILLQNSELNAIYLVRKGSVIILHVNDKGREAKVALVPEGGTVGEMEAIVGAGGVVYTAKAHTDCELMVVPVGDFLRWIETDFEACKRLSRLLAEKLYAASSQSTEYSSLNAADRLASALASMGPGVVRYTRQELAETCSCNVRTINRCVEKLMSDGFVTRHRGKIMISPEGALALQARVKHLGNHGSIR